MRASSRGWIRAGLAGLFLLLFSYGQAAADDPAPEADDPQVEEAFLNWALKPWTGDLDGMKERRAIRVLVVYDRAFYFIDDFQQRGLTYEIFTAFEKELNKRLKLSKEKQIHMVFIPVSPDRLIPGLLEGLGDIAAANLTITPERQALVDFSAPFTENVKEVLITGPDYPAIASAEELSGREVAVRPSSSYYASLVALNEKLEAAGQDPVRIIKLDEHLEDAIVVEMLAAGVYPAGVMDLYKAELWASVADKLVVHEDVVLRDGGAIGWAFRPDSPQLAKAIDAFVKKNEVGTLTTNILIKRYLESTKFIDEATSPERQARFEALVDLFKTYADQYDFDWLLLIAQGYQESGLDQSVVSGTGAVGLMQILPKTAAGDPINIKGIDKAENNVNAGAKYLRHLVDDYFDEPGINRLNRHLFGLAAYNAGPTRLQRLRQETAKAGLDPNVWFNNVEILVSKKVGREPVTYVANIFKYFIAFERIRQQQAEAEAAKRLSEQ